MGIALRELQHCNNCNAAMSTSTICQLIQEKISQKMKNFWGKHSRTAMAMLYLCRCQPTDTPPAVRNEGDTTLLPSTLDLLSLYIGHVKLLHWTC